MLSCSLAVSQQHKVISGFSWVGHQKIFRTRFMSGGAASVAETGMSDWEIKLAGRWTSETYQRYIQAPRQMLASFAKRMTLRSELMLYQLHISCT